MRAGRAAANCDADESIEKAVRTDRAAAYQKQEPKTNEDIQKVVRMVRAAADAEEKLEANGQRLANVDCQKISKKQSEQSGQRHTKVRTGKNVF